MQKGTTSIVSLDNEDKQWLSAEIREIHAKIERVETSLLTEFHKWASPAELRAKSHAAAIRALDQELEALTDRVQKLEPPH